MAYRFPTTRVSFYEGVPLNNTYTHTLYFAAEEEQTAYFDSFPEGVTKQSYSNLSFQRVSDGVIRVQANASDMWAFNYMSFANDGFGVFDRYKNKTWYAFVTGIKYINENTTEVTYEIDLMQSWMFYYDLGIQYVERETAETDNLGDNILPEPVNGGETVFNTYKEVTPELDTICYIAATSESGAYSFVDGIANGATLTAYDSVGVSQMREFLAGFSESPDSVIMIYTAPEYGVGTFSQGMKVNRLSSRTLEFGDSDFYSANYSGQSLDGYVPKNKKLYTYPYNYYCITNCNDGSLVLRYEFFEGNMPQFKVFVPVSFPVNVVLRPKNYKGSGTSGETNNNELLVLANYPQTSWTVDAFKAWAAQNSIPLLIHTATSAISSAATAGAVGAAGSILNSAANIASSIYTASISADPFKGNIATNSGNIGQGLQTFYGGRMSIKASNAKMIDDFFTRFGYSTMRLKTPNTHSRPHWNYVKLNGCSLTGHIPADDLRRLEQIYDDGITFWKNGSEVGNYSLDNSPG